ncbi:MAG: hypothetical protein MZW92_65515 [Comamonadaceae bacterium]|nr:hypothetical protein [Comamonadaceae bacterium]
MARLESELAAPEARRASGSTRLPQLEPEEDHWQASSRPWRRPGRWRTCWTTPAADAQSRRATTAPRRGMPQARARALDPEAEAAARLSRAPRAWPRPSSSCRSRKPIAPARRAPWRPCGQRRERLEPSEGAMARRRTPGRGWRRARRRMPEAWRRRAGFGQQRGRRRPDTQLPALQAGVPRRARARGAEAADRARARRDALVSCSSGCSRHGKLGDWLKRHGLDRVAPLWQSIEVEPGWGCAGGGARASGRGAAG